jgi:hypothetical protein
MEVREAPATGPTGPGAPEGLLGAVGELPQPALMMVIARRNDLNAG